MADLTDDAREALQEKLDRLDAAIGEIEKTRRPFDKAIGVLQEQRDCLLEEHGIDGEPVGNCESCGRLLLPGDLGHHIVEPGLYFCEDDAPTWRNVLDGYKELAELDNSARDPEDLEFEAQGRACAQAHVDAGDGDKKHVWEL